MAGYRETGRDWVMLRMQRKERQREGRKGAREAEKMNRKQKQRRKEINYTAYVKDRIGCLRIPGDTGLCPKGKEADIRLHPPGRCRPGGYHLWPQGRAPCLQLLKTFCAAICQVHFEPGPLRNLPTECKGLPRSLPHAWQMPTRCWSIRAKGIIWLTCLFIRYFSVHAVDSICFIGFLLTTLQWKLF